MTYALFAAYNSYIPSSRLATNSLTEDWKGLFGLFEFEDGRKYQALVVVEVGAICDAAA